ncbi:hypothetical protein ACFQ49_10380 [Kroppenstedtia eburnea]
MKMNYFKGVLFYGEKGENIQTVYTGNKMEAIRLRLEEGMSYRMAAAS